MTIVGLNHAVLWVRDAPTSAAFYVDALRFHVVDADPAGRAVFLRADGSANHHDLGLFSVGQRPSPAPQSPGLYHLAWQVARIEDLVEVERELARRGSLVGATDHGTSKSLYAKDPDGIEFEVLWLVPAEHWAALADHSGREVLDLPAEVARWSGVDSST
jgi:catechol-2,3-dioxygenase